MSVYDNPKGIYDHSTNPAADLQKLLAKQSAYGNAHISQPLYQDGNLTRTAEPKRPKMTVGADGSYIQSNTIWTNPTKDDMIASRAIITARHARTAANGAHNRSRTIWNLGKWLYKSELENGASRDSHYHPIHLDGAITSKINAERNAAKLKPQQQPVDWY